MAKKSGIDIYIKSDSYVSLSPLHMKGSKDLDEHRLKLKSVVNNSFWQRIKMAFRLVFKKINIIDNIILDLNDFTRKIRDYQKDRTKNVSGKPRFLKIVDETKKGDNFVFNSIETINIRGRGMLKIVENPMSCSNFDWIIGKNVLIDDREYGVLSVERFAYGGLHKQGERIGLLVNKKFKK